jgi:putative flippase GtrA
MKLIDLLQKNKPILLYFLCSAFTALLETGLLYFFNIAFPPLKNQIILANTIAVFMSASIHFILTSKLVFKIRMSLKSAGAYLVTFFIGLGIQNGVIWLAYEKLLPPLIPNESLLTLCSKVISLAASFFIAYFLRKWVNEQINKRERTPADE